MCANPYNNWLNAIVVRASYILPILKRFPWWKPRELEGGSLSPPGKKPKQKPLCYFEFWGIDPLNWQSFPEISEMSCSMTAWYSRGHTLNFSNLLVKDNERNENVWSNFQKDILLIDLSIQNEKNAMETTILYFFLYKSAVYRYAS